METRPWIPAVVVLVLVLVGILGSTQGWLRFGSSDASEMSTETEQDVSDTSSLESMDIPTASGTLPRAVLTTSAGEIVIELDTVRAPATAGNFIKLAGEGFYDGTRFHRVIPDFMIQGGDPLSKDPAQADRWGTGGPGYKFEDEFHPDLSNVPGTIAMANSGPNTNGSQFFINVADNSFLDFDKPPLSSKHAVFGTVVEGYDIVEEISQVATGERDRPIEDVTIESVVIEE